jgi:hypothetical protein
VKDRSGTIYAEGTIPATRFDLDHWMKTLPQPWTAMEATMFTGWIYDHLQPHAAAPKVAHPLMLRAIAAAKKKNDRSAPDRVFARETRSGKLQVLADVSRATRKLTREPANLRFAHKRVVAANITKPYLHFGSADAHRFGGPMVLLVHSYRKATIGSTRIARCAGT